MGETSQGVNEIKDFSLPYNWQEVAFPFSLRSGGNSNWLMDYLFYDSKIMGVCMANPFNIHTNDNVTYPYTLGKCWTLLSADCGPHPSYAAFAKKVGNKMAMKIRMSQSMEVQSLCIMTKMNMFIPMLEKTFSK